MFASINYIFLSRKYNKTGLMLVISIIFCSYLNGAKAAKSPVCNANRAVGVVNFDDISIRRDMAHSPKIIVKTVSGINVNCPGKTHQGIYVKSMLGVSSIGINNYFDTNLLGVKIKWSLQPNNLSPQEMNVGSMRGIGVRKNFTGKFYISVDKNADSGVVNPIKIILARQDEKGFNTDEILFSYEIPSFKVTAKTCEVRTPQIDVPMGAVLKNTFKGVGSTSGERSFDIEVQCSGGVQATIIWQGGSSNGVIKADSTSTSAGVGIQIVERDAPLVFDTEQPLGSLSTLTQLPYKARFYQTENRIAAGSLMTTATFTVNYK
ncbi:hypothetical protein PL78_12465 [Yersinia entomophaga]|uniref:Fimbrial-type adhesion domain-containing protein n=1 Tax=Yersinia entomophaga TaxID=935293 RepID=A0ABM6BM53_YERET|nr:fimbrial protein [Yersinia entomophaga]ANI30636.1 hypothetical protein PL78_12465 [Yersinia entomophaga]OWF88007.1 hypothetical protein B4914_09385 [Yersinia entomophaga]